MTTKQTTKQAPAQAEKPSAKDDFNRNLAEVTSRISEHPRISAVARSGRLLREGVDPEAIRETVHTAVEQSLANFDAGLNAAVDALKNGTPTRRSKVQVPGLATL